MKLGMANKTFALLLAAAVCSIAEGAATGQNPVSRVTKMLQDLSAKLQSDLKKEEDLFERYACWYKSVVDSKTASNSAAQSRIESLESYVADIDAGRIEFTTERADLELQLKGLNRDIEIADAKRVKEKADFEAAQTEMVQAIKALGEAIKVLEEGAAEPSEFLSMRWRLRKVIGFGSHLLSADDSKLLEAALFGDVPRAEWKKLNRKATFKMKYTSQTGKILETLKKLESTFQDNLAQAEETEAKAQASYDELSASKKALKSSTEESLVTMVKENGARGLSKEQSLAEIAALKDQVAADKDFISQVTEAHASKEKEWTARKELRTAEITGISKAIAVLHDDAARDLFKASFKSQGFALLQQPGHHHRQQVFAHHHKATSCLRDRLRSLALSSKDRRMILLAQMVTGSESIQLVVTKIDELVRMLQSEEEDDLTTKEDCEKRLAKTGREAKLQSVAIDEYADAIVHLQEKIKDIDAQIKEEQDELAKLESALLKMTRQREDEKKQFKADKIDDQQAVVLVEEAAKILQDMMKTLKAGGSGGSELVDFMQLRQTSLRRAAGSHSENMKQQIMHESVINQPFEIQAGKAPPPPPSTWEEPAYKGAQGESDGIIAILDMIKEDILQDITKAETEESEAQAEYDKQKKDIEVAMQASKDAVSDYKEEKATHEKDIVEKGELKTTKKKALKGTMEEFAAMKPGCDFILVNYNIRNEKRTEEIDGLLKAKAILSGADFSEGSLLQKC